MLADRENLEAMFGGIIRGMAYPFGTTSDSVGASLKQCGIAYARSTLTTEGFGIPTDWLFDDVTVMGHYYTAKGTFNSYKAGYTGKQYLSH